MSTALAQGPQADHYQATLALEQGASVYITAPTIDLLAQLVARTKGQMAANAPAIAKAVDNSAGVSADEKAEVVKAVSPKSVEPPAPSPSTAAPAAAPSTKDAPSAADVSQDQVNKAVLTLAGKKGRDAAVTVLQGFGVAKATELKPEQRADALAKLTAALEA